ncbi:hypothetical protein ACFQZV_05365 [Microbacterium koreense]|uniref:Uncharacterized protein n=1 Tax=Microbacterium koreense TaxID=323761 RepID=A0ABW2ZQD8_9MICO
MPEFLRQAVFVLPVVGVLLIVRAVNMSRSIRVRQYPMPVIAAAFAVVALIALHGLNSRIDELLRGLFGFLPFLRGLYDTTWQYAIENTAIVLVFLIIKLVLRSVFSRIFQGEDFFGSSVVQGVYRFDVDYAGWFVRSRSAMLRQYLRTFYWVSMALMILLLTLAGMYPTWPGFQSIAFPAMAVLVIGECFFAIDGLTKSEFRRDVLGEKDSADRVTDYAGLREVLTETFPGRALDDGVEFASSAASHTFDQLSALAHSSDDVDRLVAGYFERLKRSGVVLDTNLVAASADLMRGRSTLISNPFYGDLTPYVVFPAYYHLLQYRKCLIISGRDSIATDLVEWMDAGLRDVTGIPGLWRVEQLTTITPSDLDVGVLRFADIHNLDLIQANDDFLRDVEYVILAEPSRTLATGQLGLSVVLGRCAGDRAPVFAAFDRNHDGLVDALSHLLKVDLTDVVAPSLPRGVTSEIVWRADGPSMHAEVLPAVSRYLGMGTEIGAVALKYQVSDVEWVGSDAFPVHDMMWIAGQYYSQINAFADLDLSQHAFADVFHSRSNPWDVARAPGRFLIVEDEMRNVYETVRLYATRADTEGFINLISEDYLLRDYMVANSRIFAADAKAVPSIVPDFARTERNLVLRLLLVLRTFGMTESALAREFELTGRVVPPVEPPTLTPEDDDREPPVIEMLRELARLHAGVEHLLLRMNVDEGAPPTDADGDPVLQRHYGIPAGTAVDALVERLHAAYFFVEDEAEGRDYLGSTLYGLVYQSLLPGQFVTYAGKYYEVLSIGDDVRRSGVVLRRAAEHIRDRRTYRQLRVFELGSLRESERTGARLTVGGVALTRLFATIHVSSLGYIELPARSDLQRGRETLISGIPSRTHHGKEILAITLPGSTAEVRRTIAVLLNELFVTVFPDAHHYLVALTEDESNTVGHLLDGFTIGDGADPDAIYLVEDSPIDMGLLIAVERNWRRLFEIVTDYLEWNAAPRDEQPAPKRGDDVAVPEFPDDTPEELAQRRRIAAAQDASAQTSPRAPARRPWWRRLWQWTIGLFPTSRRVTPVPAMEDAASTSGAHEETPTDARHAPSGAIADDIDRDAPAAEEGAVPLVVDYAESEVDVERDIDGRSEAGAVSLEEHGSLAAPDGTDRGSGSIQEPRPPDDAGGTRSDEGEGQAHQRAGEGAHE